MQYWIDRVHTSEDSPEVTEYSPVSFVTHDTEQLKSMLAPDDEVVSEVHEATKEWTFVMKPGDVFPVQIIASIQSTLSASTDNPFDAMKFPVVYRGHVVEERRLFKTRGDYLNIQTASMPIFNLNPPAPL